MTNLTKGGAVPVDGLSTASWARPIDAEHVARLVGARDWPPIVVTPAGVIIDGRHRVAAAKLLGLEAVACSVADGTPAELILLAIKANSHHGMPWDAAARMSAARYLLEIEADWSNGRIAAMAGVTPRAVQAMRDARDECPTVELDDSGAAGGPRIQRRIGLDGKARPVNRDAVRATVEQMLEDDPDVTSSLVHQRTGSSRTTFLKIKKEWAIRRQHEASREQTLARLEKQRQVVVLEFERFTPVGDRHRGAIRDRVRFPWLLAARRRLRAPWCRVIAIAQRQSHGR